LAPFNHFCHIAFGIESHPQSAALFLDNNNNNQIAVRDQHPYLFSLVADTDCDLLSDHQ